MSDITQAASVMQQGFRDLGQGVSGFRKEKRLGKASKNIMEGSPGVYGGEEGQQLSADATREGNFGVAVKMMEPDNPFSKIAQLGSQIVSEKDPDKRAQLAMQQNQMLKAVRAYKIASKVGGSGSRGPGKIKPSKLQNIGRMNNLYNGVVSYDEWTKKNPGVLGGYWDTDAEKKQHKQAYFKAMNDIGEKNLKGIGAKRPGGIDPVVYDDVMDDFGMVLKSGKTDTKIQWDAELNDNLNQRSGGFFQAMVSPNLNPNGHKWDVGTMYHGYSQSKDFAEFANSGGLQIQVKNNTPAPKDAPKYTDEEKEFGAHYTLVLDNPESTNKERHQAIWYLQSHKIPYTPKK